MNKTLMKDLESANQKIFSRQPTARSMQSKGLSSQGEINQLKLPTLKSNRSQSVKPVNQRNHFLDNSVYNKSNRILMADSRNAQITSRVDSERPHNQSISEELATQVIESNRRANESYYNGMIRDCEYHLKIAERLIVSKLPVEGNRRDLPSDLAALFSLTVYNLAFINVVYSMFIQPKSIPCCYEVFD